MSKEESEKKKAGLVTVLTAICKDSQFPFALVLPSKASVDYASKALMSWIKDLKWDKVVIQFDQEKVKAGMGDTVTLRRSPRYSSQSLADGEMVNGLIAGKVRTWLAEVSEKYKMKIGCDSVLFPWIVRHSAWTLARIPHQPLQDNCFQNCERVRLPRRNDDFRPSGHGKVPQAEGQVSSEVDSWSVCGKELTW